MAQSAATARIHKAVAVVACVLASLFLAPAGLAESEPLAPALVSSEPPPGARAGLGRGAGLRIGTWDVSEMDDPALMDSSESPALEGYFQKELDVRLVLESTVGVWRRSLVREETDITGTTREETESYVVPLLTSLRFYPMTQSRRLTPYVGAGVGFVLGLQNRDLSGNGPVPSNPDTGSSLHTGVAYKVGTGVDWKLDEAFSLTFGGRYQWVRFDEEVGGLQYYRGLTIDAGVTYRFQGR